MSENLRHTSLRETLNNILFDGDEELKRYIVPLQGNWYNPTTGEEAKNTWIGYVIDSVSYDSSAIHQGTKIVRTGKANIHLTFIGDEAEDIANSIAFWPYRQDVVKEFDKYRGVLNNQNIKVYTSLYMQEGLATTLCYNVNLTVMYNETLDISSVPLSRVDVTGELIYK
jgi:hypothetical protein